MVEILQTTFSNAFSWKKNEFASNFTEVCSSGSTWKKLVISLEKSLAAHITEAYMRHLLSKRFDVHCYLSWLY